MPERAFFCSVTAAVVIQVPLPRHLEESRLLHVAVPNPRRAPSGRGIAGHSVQMTGGETWIWRGLPLSTPERLWCELGAVLSIPDLVAAGDYLIRRRKPLTSTAALATAIERFPGRRGLRALQASLPLLDTRSESRRESHLRLIVTGAKLAGLEVNFPITTSGGFHYRGDLAFPGHRVIIEYQGDYHRDPEQFRKDMTRISRLQADGWFVMQLNANDLHDPAELLQRIRHVLETH